MLFSKGAITNTLSLEIPPHRHSSEVITTSPYSCCKKLFNMLPKFAVWSYGFNQSLFLICLNKHRNETESIANIWLRHALLIVSRLNMRLLPVQYAIQWAVIKVHGTYNAIKTFCVCIRTKFTVIYLRCNIYSFTSFPFSFTVPGTRAKHFHTNQKTAQLPQSRFNYQEFCFSFPPRWSLSNELSIFWFAFLFICIRWIWA